MKSSLLVLGLLLTIGIQAQQDENDQDVLLSRWAKNLNTDQVWQEYPRPQMQRKDWLNLNGYWEYAIEHQMETSPTYEGQILVPFPVESHLSGVKRKVGAHNKLWYKRHFSLPANWKGKDLLLHFGAVDWQAEVYVNGQLVGQHQGGYDPFSFPIHHALVSGKEQEIVVAVWDPTSEGTQARGKQQIRPQGIWYTPVTGIWQTVWIEPLNTNSIENLRWTSNIDTGTVKLEASYRGMTTSSNKLRVIIHQGDKALKTVTVPINEALTINLDNPELWTPDNPFLYTAKVQLLRKGKVVDEVDSYFAMRKISVGKTADGHERLFLNNEPLFQLGTLDQGWWPGGLYTAPSDEALKFDIEKTKELGYNMIRKHVKVESARWYYHCDKVGMLVWQDMPNGDKGADWRGPSGYDGREMVRTANSEHQYRKEWKNIMDALYHFPSIVMWVPFNEAWGQFKTKEIIRWTMEHDTTRLVNGPSGGNFFPVGHTVDQHQYPGPGMPLVDKHAPEIINERVLVLGEFGGLGLPMKGHLWQKDKNWGYRKLDTQKELTESYVALMKRFPPLIEKGLSAAIYTQTTDVEGEVNGLMTYDREIIKMDKDEINKVNSRYCNYFETFEKE
jgi:beta-galactosidase/beta-glucuronidase